MPTDSIRPLLDQALTLLRENRPQDAIDTLDRIGEQGDRIPDQLAYRGLAKAKLGDKKEATRLLRRAVEIAPSECRHRYTLAVHLREMGDTDDAREQAMEARRLDPKFLGIDQLYSSLGMDASKEPKPTLRDKLFAPPLQTPAFGTFHAFPALEQAAKQWTQLGWLLVILNFVPLMAFKFHFPVHAAARGEAKGLPGLGGYVINSDPLTAMMVFLLIVVMLLSAAWMITDMLDRRARAVWIVPFIPFCVFCWMPGVGQALYMSLGRK